MNDHTLQQLERLVEQCVRPVRTDFADKKRMREDLLSHLSSTFEEELERCGDERAALQQTLRRFGNPADVTHELQQTLSWQHRFSYFTEQIQARQPGESYLYLGMKHFLYALVLSILTSTLILIVRGNNVRTDPATMFWVFAVILAGMSITGSCSQWLVDGMGRALISKSKKSQLRYGLLSVFLYPAAMFAIHLGLMLGPRLGEYQISSSAMLAASATACFGPLVVWLMGPMMAERILYQEKWAAIDLTER
ncbi:MAG: hypothetical protein HUJ26_06215 [Planctomycetaceae bacterium]|nr:hypothetical protein [Planctomycetaceae bacterium]